MYIATYIYGELHMDNVRCQTIILCSVIIHTYVHRYVAMQLLLTFWFLIEFLSHFWENLLLRNTMVYSVGSIKRKKNVFSWLILLLRLTVEVHHSYLKSIDVFSNMIGQQLFELTKKFMVAVIQFHFTNTQWYKYFLCTDTYVAMYVVTYVGMYISI